MMSYRWKKWTVYNTEKIVRAYGNIRITECCGPHKVSYDRFTKEQTFEGFRI